MKRTAAVLSLAVVCVLALTIQAAAATSISARYQLRGHLPELGEKPTMRAFVTQAAYDSYRNSLGDANVFPPASSLFMSFDKDILALYTRGNDVGGRCFATSTSASLDGDTATIALGWQVGTCGAPSSAHYPFILVALSRTAADGSTWTSPARSVCASAPDAADSRACAVLSGAATPAPTASPPPAPTTAPTATPGATATRSLTPTVSPTATAAPASATPAATTTPTRSPVAAASPTPSPADAGTNYLLYGMLIAIGFLVGVALMLSRGSRRGP
jgi:hypothetical protein